MVAVPDHAPVHVWDNMVDGDIIFAHELGGELRGAVDGDVNIVAPVYTHFDADGGLVSFAFIVGMLSCFVSRQGLINGMIVHCKMPGEKSSAIVTGSQALVHGHRMVQCVGATRGIVRRMNRDVCRAHRPMQGTAAVPWRDDALSNVQLACTGGSRGADRGGAAMRRTRRKERTY